MFWRLFCANRGRRSTAHDRNCLVLDASVLTDAIQYPNPGSPTADRPTGTQMAVPQDFIPFANDTSPGLLKPDDYRDYIASPYDLKLASIVFGFELGFFVLTLSKVVHQMWAIFERRGKLTVYAYMILSTLCINLAFSVLQYALVNGSVRGTFWFFFFQVTLLNLQIQLLVQIVVGRISLLLVGVGWKKKLKWWTVGLMGVLNVCLYVFGIPGQLQWLSPWFKANEVWQQLDKALTCVLDIWLNGYFVYVIRTRLMAGGNTGVVARKWKPLWHYSIPVAASNVLVDFLLVGTTAHVTADNYLLMLQFFGLFYMVKLNIELSMASMVAQIAKSTISPRFHNSEQRDIDESLSGAGDNLRSGIDRDDTPIRLDVPYKPYSTRHTKPIFGKATCEGDKCDAGSFYVEANNLYHTCMTAAQIEQHKSSGGIGKVNPPRSPSPAKLRYRHFDIPGVLSMSIRRTRAQHSSCDGQIVKKEDFDVVSQARSEQDMLLVDTPIENGSMEELRHGLSRWDFS